MLQLNNAIAWSGFVCTVLAGQAMAGNLACPGLDRPTLNEDLCFQAGDAGSSDFFGWTVAIDGGRAVVGAHQQGPFVSGKAYLIDVKTGSVIAGLAPSDGGTGDSFGYSVAIDGDTVIVGSIRHVIGGIESGAAYLYNVAGASGEITETAKLIASDREGSDLIGVSVAVSGDRVVVGAEGVESAYVFDIAGASGTVTEIATLGPSDGTFRFGAAVAIDGANAIVGAPHGGAGTNPNGKAYVFDLTAASGVMTETARLVPTNGANGDQFGASVAIDGDNVVVGALRNEGNDGIRAGTVYLFDVAKAGGQVPETAMLLASDRTQADNFGRSVSVRGSTVIVGASNAIRDPITIGTAYQFSIADAHQGGVICEQAMFRSSVAGTEDFFGTSVAYDGTHALVGAPGSIRLTNPGKVCRYRINADFPEAGIVIDESKISALSGGFQGPLGAENSFGSAVVGIGDLDGDGIDDLAVGAFRDNFDSGAIWILFMNADGTVRDEQKIAPGVGGFSGPLVGQARFGRAIAAIGDLDGDGVPDLVVGASNDSGSGNLRGAAWVLFMNTDGTVRAEQKISEANGGFAGALNDFAFFGGSAAAIGDLDGDGVPDLAVGAAGDTDGGTSHGAIWVLFMNADGTVRDQQKISSTSGGFAGALNDFASFGGSAAALGDLDGDGTADLVVGSHNATDGGVGRGAVWVLFMNADGTVKGQQKISSTSGGFSGPLMNNDQFGFGVASLGDIDTDGVPDIAVGVWRDSQEGQLRGSVWIIFLNTDGTVKYDQKISGTQGAFAGPLENLDAFGSSVGAVGNILGDGRPGLAVGAIGDDDGFQNAGAVWLLSLNGVIPENEPRCNAADIAPDFGVLDVNDVIGFVNAFNGGEPTADVSPFPGGDGILNVNDIIVFVKAFNAGCGA